MKRAISQVVNLENFVGIILMLLPLYLIKMFFLKVPWNFLEIMISGAFVWWLWEKRWINPNLRNFFKNNKIIFGLIGIIFLSLLLSTFLNNNLRVGLGIIKGWFIFPLVLALITTDIFRDKKIKALEFFYGGAVGVAAIALISFFLGQITFDGRLQGIFNSPNYLAMYLSPAILIGLTLAQNKDVKIKTENYNLNTKGFHYLSSAMMLVVLYLTYSYAAWIALVLTVVIIFILNKKFTVKIAFLFLFLLGALFYFQADKSKWTDFVNLNERSSFASRLMIWKSTGKIIGDNPVWGIGPGNFQEKYLKYQRYYPSYLEWAVPHPHNLYLAFYLYSGVMGLAAFLSLMFLWIKIIIPKNKEKIVLVSLGIIMYFLLHGLVDTTYFKNDLAVIFWLAFWLPL